MQWYFRVLKQYAVFRGRARRMEYWMFNLISALVTIALVVVEAILGVAPYYGNESILLTIYSVAIMVPSIAVGVRRMHDSNRSGWWFIVPIANFVFSLLPGTPGDNRFGSDPKVAKTTEESARRLAGLGGTEKTLEPIPRRGSPPDDSRDR